MFRTLRSTVRAGLIVAALAVPASASADTIFTLGAGYFALKAEDARVEGDVLSRNLDFLFFELNDFNGGAVNAEFGVGLGRFVEASVGVGFTQRTVPSIYTDYVDNDGTEIDQDLKLRTAPVTAIVRLFPAGRFGGFQPYVGGGVAVVSWRYSETGEFVDFSDGTIFRESYVDSGNATGPVVLGGIRFPMGDALLFGGELRYHDVKADLDPSLGFAGEKIDLGGYTTTFTFSIRF
jgi:outer membrane protein W